MQGELHRGSAGLLLACGRVGSAAQATSAPPAARGSPHSLRAPMAPAGGLGAAGKQQECRGEAARPGPSPELGVVDQGAQGSAEGGHVALQPRRAGSGHGRPQGARRREEARGWRQAIRGCREAGQPGEAAGRKPAGCVVRHGPLLGKPGRQRRGWRPGCRGSGGREPWDNEA